MSCLLLYLICLYFEAVSIPFVSISGLADVCCGVMMFCVLPGSFGCHVELSTSDKYLQEFYTKLGFVELGVSMAQDTVFLGRTFWSDTIKNQESVSVPWNIQAACKISDILL